MVRPGVRRLSYGLVDQGAASLTTLCLSVGALRGPTDAAAEFAVVFIGYALATGFCRSITTEPRAPELPASSPAHLRSHVRASTVVALAVGGLTALLCAVLLRPDTPLGLLSLALPLVGVPVDAVRAAWIGGHRTDRAVVTSLVQLAAAAVGLVVTLLTGEALWVLAPVVIAQAVLVGIAFMLTPGAPVGHLLRPRHWTYALEWGLTFGQQQVGQLVLAGIGLPLLPLLLRAQGVVFGPLTTLAQAAAALSVPEFVSLRRRRPTLAAAAAALSGLLVLGSALYAVVVFVVPDAVLAALLGSADAEYRPVLLASAVTVCLIGAGMGPLVAMRAHDAPRSSLGVRVVIGCTALVATFVGGLVWGAAGYFWGASLASVVGAVCGFVVLARIERRPADELAEVAP